jgi:hypothetical protein
MLLALAIEEKMDQVNFIKMNDFLFIQSFLQEDGKGAKWRQGTVIYMIKKTAPRAGEGLGDYSPQLLRALNIYPQCEIQVDTWVTLEHCRYIGDPVLAFWGTHGYKEPVYTHAHSSIGYKRSGASPPTQP